LAHKPGKIIAIMLSTLPATTTLNNHFIRFSQVVLWHGMGDSCCDPDTMGRVAGLIQEALPGTFVHSIQVGDDPENDANAGFFGNINEQVSVDPSFTWVCVDTLVVYHV
jgi:hypothetical protein